MPLTLTPLKNIPLIRQGDNLADILLNSLRETQIELQDNDIFVLAQKIVSKAEGRMVNLATVTPSPQALELSEKSGKDPRAAELLLQESAEVLRIRQGTVIAQHKLGFICANAGIDQSNVKGDDDGEYVLLLPANPDSSAKRLRDALRELTGRRVGVMIIDSHGRAWRIGTVGVCIGLSSIPAMVD